MGRSTVTLVASLVMVTGGQFPDVLVAFYKINSFYTLSAVPSEKLSI